MLKEINCDLFTEKTIIFKEGFNVILGDEASTNSIGKSTSLMVIDFVFGGESYLKNNSGTIEALGHHVFKFYFSFGNDFFYFRRDTAKPDIVYKCNNKYEVTDILEINDYTQFLKTNYINGLDELTFRGIVSLYSRIWGKENLNGEKPLQLFTKETEGEAIIKLIKLFNEYTSISELLKIIKVNDESKNVLSGAIKKDYITKVTKIDYKNNEIKINHYKSQINEIKDGLISFTLNLNELKNKEVLELREKKNKLLDGFNIIQNKIKRIEINLNRKSSLKPSHLSLLTSFFPNSNIDKINEIESFHNKITVILNKQLLESKKKLEQSKQQFLIEIESIDKKINDLLQNIESPKYIIDRVLDLTIDSNKLETANKFYEEKVSIENTLIETKKELATTIKTILNGIQLKINSEIETDHKLIFNEVQRAPEIELYEKRYNFNHFNNTGTGKAFSDLILFDLAILKLTQLPILIHDSPIFKNIEDISLDNFIALYSKTNKQIFISIDGINRNSSEIQKNIISNTILRLSSSKLLFMKNWKVSQTN